MGDQRLIPLGIITAPHGIRGEVKVRSFTADPEDITAYGPLCDPTGNIIEVTITSSTKDVLIASVKGSVTRDDAEKLRNKELCVPRSALPAAGKGEYYHEDLVGLTLTDKDGKPYGTLIAVHNFGAGDLVTVKSVSGEEEMLPFNHTVFPHIDIEKKTAVIEKPVMISEEK